MTLRLVSDHDKPGEVLYCRMGGMCDIYRHRATILVSIAGNPYRPSCDECARRAYENIGDSARMAPLAEYVDMFAAAKEAALATPEQITAPVQVTASAVVDAEVIRHVWQDQVIYCRMRWCEEGGRLTPTDQRLNVIGGLWYPACAECISKFDSGQVEIYTMSEENTAWELEMAGEYAKSRHWRKPGPPMSRKAKILWWTIPSGVLALGITMTSIASAIFSNYVNGSQDGAPPDVGALKGFGIFFIVVSSLVLLVMTIGWMVSEATSLPAGQFRVPRQPRTVSQPTMSQGYQQRIPVSQLATTAAVVGGEILLHHQIRKHQARVRDSALGIAPLNNVHAGMKHATAILAQQKQQYQQQQQCQPDSLQPPFTSTPVSEIYGNATYRPRPWL